MPMSFCGQPLLMPDDSGTIEKFVRDYLAAEYGRLFSWAIPTECRSRPRTAQIRTRENAIAGLGRPNWPAPPPLKLNQLYWPTGASRWGVGLFLIDNAGLTAIGGAATASLGGPLKIRGSLDDNPGTSTFTPTMYALPPRLVSVATDGNPLWLLPLVDVRYFSQTWGLTSAFDLNQSGSWTGLMDLLCEEIAFDGSGAPTSVLNQPFTTLPATFHPDVTELRRWGDSPGVLLDAVLASVGVRLVVDLNSNARIAKSSDPPGFNVLTNADGSPSQGPRVAGGICTDSTLTNVEVNRAPASVTVNFPIYTLGILPYQDNYQPYQIDALVANYFGPTNPDTNLQFFTTAYSDQAGVTGAKTNDTDCFNLAFAVAASYYAWLGNSYDFTFAELSTAWNMTGRDDFCLITLASHEKIADDYESTAMDTATHGETFLYYQEGNAVTMRVCSLPANFAVAEHLHQFYYLGSENVPLPRLLENIYKGILETTLFPTDACTITPFVTDPTNPTAPPHGYDMAIVAYDWASRFATTSVPDQAARGMMTGTATLKGTIPGHEGGILPAGQYVTVFYAADDTTWYVLPQDSDECCIFKINGSSNPISFPAAGPTGGVAPFISGATRVRVDLTYGTTLPFPSPTTGMSGYNGGYLSTNQSVYVNDGANAVTLYIPWFLGTTGQLSWGSQIYQIGDYCWAHWSIQHRRWEVLDAEAQSITRNGPFFAKITGGIGTALYSWKEQVCFLGAILPRPGGRTGASNAIEEENASEYVLTNEQVIMWQQPGISEFGNTYYLFQYNPAEARASIGSDLPAINQTDGTPGQIGGTIYRFNTGLNQWEEGLTAPIFNNTPMIIRAPATGVGYIQVVYGNGVWWAVPWPKLTNNTGSPVTTAAPTTSVTIPTFTISTVAPPSNTVTAPTASITYPTSATFNTASCTLTFNNATLIVLVPTLSASLAATSINHINMGSPITLNYVTSAVGGVTGTFLQSVSISTTDAETLAGP